MLANSGRSLREGARRSALSRAMADLAQKVLSGEGRGPAQAAPRLVPGGGLLPSVRRIFTLQRGAS
jgi:hypothetical protein